MAAKICNKRVKCCYEISHGGQLHKKEQKDTKKVHGWEFYPQSCTFTLQFNAYPLQNF